jgi:hypothetical protein
MRWRLVLPVVPLMLFAVISYQSVRSNDATSRYFWWSSIPLDSEPLNKSHSACKLGIENCQVWGPDEILLGPTPLPERALFFSAIPAFLLCFLIEGVLGQLGISKVLTFMVSMPLLIGSWFHFLGWLIDNWGRKRHAVLE